MTDQGANKITFGKHAGKTFREVVTTQPSYCKWALGVKNPTGALRTFRTYAELHSMTPAKAAVYKLRLANDKYYVGKSADAPSRVQAHFAGKGSKWTQTHKPIELLWTRPMATRFDEENETLQAMEDHGVANVRGGSYCRETLTEDDLSRFRVTMNALTDRCYRCGSGDHFVGECPKSVYYEAPEENPGRESCCDGCVIC